MLEGVVSLAATLLSLRRRCRHFKVRGTGFKAAAWSWGWSPCSWGSGAVLKEGTPLWRWNPWLWGEVGVLVLEVAVLSSRWVCSLEARSVVLRSGLSCLTQRCRSRGGGVVFEVAAASGKQVSGSEVRTINNLPKPLITSYTPLSFLSCPLCRC
jgi:hypothetical protein